jgi:integrase
MRRAELCHLKVEDIDSTRMIIHIHHGKRIVIATCRSARNCSRRSVSTGAG